MPIEETVECSSGTSIELFYHSSAEGPTWTPHILFRVKDARSQRSPGQEEALYNLLKAEIDSNSGITSVITGNTNGYTLPPDSFHISKEPLVIEIYNGNEPIPDGFFAAFPEAFVETINAHIRTVGERLPVPPRTDTIDIELIERAADGATMFMAETGLANLKQAGVAAFLCNQRGMGEETIRTQAAAFLRTRNALGNRAIDRLTEKALAFGESERQRGRARD